MKHAINCIPAVMYLLLIPLTLRGAFDKISHESIVLLLVIAALQSLYPVIHKISNEVLLRIHNETVRDLEAENERLFNLANATINSLKASLDKAMKEKVKE